MKKASFQVRWMAAGVASVVFAGLLAGAIPHEAELVGRYDTHIMGGMHVMIDTTTGQCWASHYLSNGWSDLGAPIKPSGIKKGHVGKYRLRTQTLYESSPRGNVPDGGMVVILDTTTGATWRASMNNSGRIVKKWTSVSVPLTEKKKPLGGR